MPRSLSFRMNRVQRLLLFAGATLWFIASVAAQQRNFQDAWILQDVLWQSAGFAVVFLWVLAREDDNRVVALLCASAVSVAALVPGLKYQQPYGTSIDAVSHYIMTKNLVLTGYVLADNVYASIASMHAWLAALALTAGVTADQVIRFGMPFLAGLLPLLVYWLCRRTNMQADLTKYTVAASCLAAFPAYMPNGTLFTLVPLFLLLGTLVLREFYCVSRCTRRALTVLALLALVQIVMWHSTTPMAVPAVLAVTSATPLLVAFAACGTLRVRPASGLLWFAFLAAGLFVGYHVISGSRVLTHTLASFARLLASPQTTPAVVPARLFEITLADAARIATVMHGRDLVLVGLTMWGLVVIWRRRLAWARLLYLYAFFLLVCVAFAILMVASIGGAGYRRFTWAPLAASPFFVGPALWWLMNELPRYARARHALRLSGRVALVAVLLALWVVQFYPYQPLVPKVEIETSQPSTEYVLWLHEVNTAYQSEMLAWVETHSDPHLHIASDLWSQRQYQRYYGKLALAYRRGYVPLHRPQAFDPNTVHLFLLHRPGPAGGLGEQVEYRSAVFIDSVRNTDGWGLVYDNGESFVLFIP